MRKSTILKSFLLFAAGICLSASLGTADLINYVSAETTSPEETFAKWSFNEKTGKLTISGTGRLYNLEKYEEISDNTWKWAYLEPEYAKKVKRIVIEPGITQIDTAVFNSFTSLESVTIPDTVTDIEAYAFYHCISLKELTIPDSVTSIGEECFWGCTAIERISIGKNVTTIGDRAFFQCRALQKIKIDSQNHSLKMQSGILYNQEEQTLLFCLPSKKTNFTIQNGTRKIAELAFSYQKSLKHITIPASVESVEGGAFLHCSKLRRITFQKHSKCIFIGKHYYYRDGYEENYGAFEGCKKLTKLSFPDRIRYIGDSSFKGCNSLQTIHFGKNFEGFFYAGNLQTLRKKDIINCLFLRNVPIKKFTVSKSNKTFSSQNGILYNKKKTLLCIYPTNKADAVVTLPKGIRRINSGAFYYNQNIKQLILPQSLKTIENNAFEGSKNLEEIVWPKNLTAIRSYAFYRCKKLKSTTLSGKGLIIDLYAFSNCESLRNVTIKSGVKKIKQEAFYHCKKLKSVIIPDSVTQIGTFAFGKYYIIKKLPHGFTSKITTLKNFRIYGKKGSAAQKYAKENKMKFVAI